MSVLVYPHLVLNIDVKVVLKYSGEYYIVPLLTAVLFLIEKKYHNKFLIKFKILIKCIIIFFQILSIIYLRFLYPVIRYNGYLSKNICDTFYNFRNFFYLV